MGQQVPLSECAEILRPIVNALMVQNRGPRDVCGPQVYGQSAGELSYRLEWCSGWMATVRRAGGGCFSYISTQRRLTQLYKGICRHAQMTEESKKRENSVRSSGHCPLCPGPRVPCKTFRPSQSAGKGNPYRKLAREALLM